MVEALPPKGQAVAERLAPWLASLRTSDIPLAARASAANVVLDIAGLCVAARQRDYTRSLIAAWDSDGPCTAIGQSRGFDSAGAALINGTTAHGEDLDDTFEGSPLHAGAVGVPTALAVAERYGLSGQACLLGLVAGMEVMCRLTLVAPGAIHKAGFQPASVIGTIGAAVISAVTLRLKEQEIVHALGIAGSMASGLMEFLSEGAWTKRFHPGWAAQAGLRAALMARQGFVGPRTVFEGTHGYFRAFAPSAVPDYDQLLGDLGGLWRMENIAFKLYPCGTMIGPYIDCALALRNTGAKAKDIVDILCKVGQGVVDRQWEPIAHKRRPQTPFAAKFSGPFGIAVGFLHGRAGLNEYTEERVNDPEVQSLAAKVRYVVDPDNEYPRNYTGDLRVTFVDGTVRDFHQPHLRGGSREPLTRADLTAKFCDNVRFGGWSEVQGEQLRAFCDELFELPDLSGLAEFRH